MRGQAMFTANKVVEVNGQKFTAEHIVIASGSSPVKEEGKKMNEKNNSKGREFLLSAKQQGTRPLLIGTHSKVAHRWHHWAS